MSSKSVLRLVMLFGVMAYSLAVHAQSKVIEMPGASAGYDLRATVQSCGGAVNQDFPGQCSGKAKVSVIDRTSGKVFQTINLPSIYIADWREPANLYYQGGEQNIAYSFVMRDFNFDGVNDLVIATGRNGGYGTTSYNVYLFSPQKKRFIFNSAFSKLTKSPMQGLFAVTVDQLVTYMKSGSTHYEQSFYFVRNDVPVLSKKIIENYYSEQNQILKKIKIVIYKNGKPHKVSDSAEIFSD